MKNLLITGGAGFIGVNVGHYFSDKNWAVTIFDNLSRRGSLNNLEWLRSRNQIRFEKGDVRDSEAVERLVKDIRPDAVLHLAAQVAVTTSVTNPREDFEINALGTLNLLEAVRNLVPSCSFIYASTNKVYGRMEDVAIGEKQNRYEYVELESGVAEERSLDFHSPYGCSKGAADQYTIDYGRIYGLNSTVFRQSCIYGPRQFGVEDQGWVAWFAIAAMLGKPITIYGDGKQIRDVLDVSDLARAYEAALDRAGDLKGEVFNMGGGPANTMSLLEVIALLESRLSIKIPFKFDAWRPGDQPVYVSNIQKADRLLGWKPRVDASTGIGKLVEWIRVNRGLFA